MWVDVTTKETELVFKEFFAEYQAKAFGFQR